jgi:hypothetical protein
MTAYVPPKHPNVRTGLDRAPDDPGLIAQQRVGLVTSASAVTNDELALFRSQQQRHALYDVQG